MSFGLISEDEYATLPDDDEQCFVEFENICRRNMTRMIGDDTTPAFDRNVRDQYMAAVAAVAAECNIPNVIFQPTSGEEAYENFGRFSLAVQGEVARIRIRLRGERHPYSVLLTASTRTKIEHYISRIRDVVARSDLDPEQKRRLGEKLDSLAGELGSQRLSLAKTMALLAGVMATLGSAVTIAADGQSAVAHIMQLIGEDKATEDEAARRLAPPPKALPSPPARKVPEPAVPVRPSLAETFDDDIPF